MSRRIRTQADDPDVRERELRECLHDCVFDIICDLEQRKGLGDEWEETHPLQRREITDHWHALLCRRFNIDED